MAPADYAATSGTLTFANAESVKQILVPVNDNTVANIDRSFVVSLSGATGGATVLLESLPVHEATVDALWFSRASQKNREAWELRLVAETPYALFEAFELEESEEQREEVRREMEARMREYLTKD